PFAIMAKKMTVATALHDQYAAPGRAAGWLDHKIVQVAQQLRQPAQLCVAGHLGVNLGRGHADAHAQIAHPQLVIDQGKPSAWIVIQNVSRIPAVHSQNSEILQSPGSAEQPKHSCLPSLISPRTPATCPERE